MFVCSWTQLNRYEPRFGKMGLNECALNVVSVGFCSPNRLIRDFSAFMYCVRLFCWINVSSLINLYGLHIPIYPELGWIYQHDKRCRILFMTGRGGWTDSQKVYVLMTTLITLHGNRKERIRRASCTLKCVRPRCSATSTTNDTLTTIVSNTCNPRVQLGKLIAGLSPFWV